MKASRPTALLLDGGDSWQGSATALWTAGQDMVEASLELGVDVMTGHWEFTHGAERVAHVVQNDFKDKVAFMNSGELKDMAKTTKIKHWQWSNKEKRFDSVTKAARSGAKTKPACALHRRASKS